MEGFWNFGPEKPLIIAILVSFSVEAGEMTMLSVVLMLEAWILMFQKEANILLGHSI